MLSNISLKEIKNKYEDIIPEQVRLCNEDKIKHICETIKNANIKDKPLEIHLTK